MVVFVFGGLHLKSERNLVKSFYTILHQLTKFSWVITQEYIKQEPGRSALSNSTEARKRNSMETARTENNIVHIIDLNMTMKLSCDCKVPLGDLMALIGHQVLRGEAILCPYHLKEHNFSSDDIMKNYSVSYLRHCLNEKFGDDFFTTFGFPPSHRWNYNPIV